MADQEIKIEDHSKKAISQVKKQLLIGLMSCGAGAEGYAKDESPVDTGRLRNSITWAITNKQSQPNQNGGEDAKPDDYKKRAEPEELAVYIGTNVEYAPQQELISMRHKVGKAHFLRDGISSHIERYKKILKAALKS